MIATSLDNEKVLLSRYPDAAANIAFLRESGVLVHHSVDATALTDSPVLQSLFEAANSAEMGRLVIIFNHPHHGGRVCYLLQKVDEP